MSRSLNYLNKNQGNIMKVVIEYQRYVKSNEYNTFENEERVLRWNIEKMKDKVQQNHPDADPFKYLTQEINTTKVDLEMWRKDYLGHVLLMEDYNDFSFPMTDEIWLTELYAPIKWSKWALYHRQTHVMSMR